MVWFSVTVTSNVSVDMQMRTWLQMAIVVLTAWLIVVVFTIAMLCMEIHQTEARRRRSLFLS